MAGDYFSQFAIVVPNLFSSYSTAIFFSHAIAFLSWFSMLNINVFFMVLMLLFPILSVLIWHQKKRDVLLLWIFAKLSGSIIH